MQHEQNTAITIDLPGLVFVPDYHDFPDLHENLMSLTGNKEIKLNEIAFGSVPVSKNNTAYKYIAVIYLGAKPDKKQIDSLLEKHNVIIDDDYLS